MFYDLKKTACSAKFLFGSYERRTVSGSIKKHDFFNFGAIFRPDLFILTELKMASIDLTDKNYMHTNFQINPTIIHLSIAGKPPEIR